jgi:hypothetical protein
MGGLTAAAVDVAAHTATMRFADLAFRRMGFDDRRHGEAPGRRALNRDR